MFESEACVWTWREIGQSLAGREPGAVLRVPKACVEHPSAAGLSLSIGLPFGQRADYRLRLKGCQGLHVHDFGTHYEAHLDKVHPECGVVEHLRRDAPKTYVGVGIVVGALAGILLTKKPQGALAGAIAGAVVSLMTAEPEPARQQQTAKANATWRTT